MRWSFLVVVACLAALAGCGSNKGAGGSGAGGMAGVDGGPGGAAGSGTGGGSSGTGGGANVPGPICFLTSCSSDAGCKDCSFGRTRCDVGSQRCVACDPATGQGCPANKTCTKYGTCAPAGASCPVDSQGSPTVTCAADADCAACDPGHQICDAASKKCVSCSATDVSACKGNEHCGPNGSCILNCPDNCTADAECAQCGTSSAPAHACNKKTRECGQCSATSPCHSGEICSPQGVCVKACGLPDKAKGTCATDKDCTGCGADAVACHVPVNGGDGRCGLPASGCSDIGKGVTALPAPWSSVTNTCSSDTDCSGVGLDLNVGKMLRDISGIKGIHDATLQYGMHSCASVSVGLNGNNYSCGLCVPCKTDADCTPIQVDPVVNQAFSGLGKIAAKWALDKLYGDKPHVINMYCQDVAGSYGVCAPCSDPSSVCGVKSTVGSGCTNVWECAAGEYCTANKCQQVAPDCYGGTETCPSGTVCAWNGGGRYCCRVPGTGTKSCTNDAECAPQICSKDAKGNYYCMNKAATCT